MATNSIAPASDELRAHLHRQWDSVAAAWGEHAEYADGRGEPVTGRLLEATKPEQGERVLELACGAGGVGIEAARLVGPTGAVVLSDVSPEMTAIAASRARGLDNISSRPLDLEQIDEPDASYDVVLCREGLMLVPDPARGAREIRRVLKPGGRAAVAVWGPRERNPWLTVVFDAVAAALGAPVPPPGIPGPFSLDDGDRLAAILREAELADVKVVEVAVPYVASSPDEWWARTVTLAGPLAKRLAGLPEPALEALRARALDGIADYATPDGRLVIPGVSLVASGVRHL
jgi:enediyne biosynthesis protein CalE5